MSLEGLQNAHEVSVATEAAYVVACIYDGGQGCERSPSRAAHLYARAAEDGVEAVRNAALYNLATLTLAGADGIQKDPKLAFLMYETAALAGHANAAYNVASLLGNGEGVARDFAGAKKWFSIAASRGHSGALKQEAFLSRRNFVSTALVFASAMALAIVTCVVLISSFA